ncbi:MAG TPA: BsuPI-related putative proteinase inhibitor [Longimicrobiales bacterium]
MAAMLPFSACSIEKREGTAPNTEIDVGGQTKEDSVLISISAPRAAAVGDEIPISIVVENNRDRQIDLNLTGRDIVFDIVVARADSSIVWRRLAHTTVQQILHLKTLPARGAFTVSDRWMPTEPGEYTIGAELPTDSSPLQAEPVTITVR